MISGKTDAWYSFSEIFGFVVEWISIGIEIGISIGIEVSIGLEVSIGIGLSIEIEVSKVIGIGIWNKDKYR